MNEFVHHSACQPVPLRSQKLSHFGMPLKWAQPSKERKVFCIPPNSPWAAACGIRNLSGLNMFACGVRPCISKKWVARCAHCICPLHVRDGRCGRANVSCSASARQAKTNKADKCACDRNWKRDQRTHSQSATISDTVTGHIFELTVGECELLVSIRCFVRLISLNRIRMKAPI